MDTDFLQVFLTSLGGGGGSVGLSALYVIVRIVVLLIIIVAHHPPEALNDTPAYMRSVHVPSPQLFLSYDF